MSSQGEELVKRPLYVFDLPPELLVTLQLKDSILLQPRSEELEPKQKSLSFVQDGQDPAKKAASCALCTASFVTLEDQRRHVKSDWHGYNLKQKLRGVKPVSEIEFERLVGDLNESISGSELSSSEEDEPGNRETTLSALLKKQARLHDEGTEDDSSLKKRKVGSGNPPLFWFSSSLLPANISLGVYRALFTDSDQRDQNLVETLRKKQLKPVRRQPGQNENHGVPLSASIIGPNIFFCMIGGGHFAAMIVSLTPKIGKKATGIEERQAIVIAHKTFHRYTTRRKQGGSQSANDSAKGAAHSAGAGIRRYNEAALESEVRALLFEWKDMIKGCELLFVRATGTTNRRTLFGPYEDQILRQTDPRNRSFPFSTRRATQAELMRAFVELTRVKVSEVDQAALAAAAAESAKPEELQRKSAPTGTKPVTPRPSKEDEAALLHTSQLQALIRRSKAPAVLSYLIKNSISSDFTFHPPAAQANHHATTPLHLAASSNSPVLVLALLVKAGANPNVLNGEGKPAFDLAGDRPTRDAFRVARFELGEDRWRWDDAHVPPPIAKAEADQRDASERAELQKAETDRRKAETERLDREAQQQAPPEKKTTGNMLGGVEMTAADRREREARGLTPEMRAKLERERRARAAEERMKRTAGR